MHSGLPLFYLLSKQFFWAKFYEAETQHGMSPAKDPSDPCNLQAYKEQQKCYKTQLEKSSRFLLLAAFRPRASKAPPPYDL